MVGARPNFGPSTLQHLSLQNRLHDMKANTWYLQGSGAKGFNVLSGFH